MLVLTRKTGEDIRIGDDIVISVVKARGQRVRLGIVAPTWVSIRREELLAKDEVPKEEQHSPGNG